MGGRTQELGVDGGGGGSGAEESAGGTRGHGADRGGLTGHTASDESDDGSGSSEGGAEVHWELTRSQRGKGSRELARMTPSPGFRGSSAWGEGGRASRCSASRASVAGRRTPAVGGGAGAEEGGGGAGEGIRRVTGEVPTRQTLRRGVRIGEEVVAWMDRGDATRLGEQRARLRQRQAEASQLEDG